MTQRTESHEEARRFLRIYCADHLAGAAAGSRRARRLAAAERTGPDGPLLGALAEDILQDRQALQAIVDHLGLAPPRYKQVLARAAEWIGLVKLNGRLIRRSPLSTLVEVEGLLMGVRGKLAGWETLRATLGTPVVGRADLDQLIDRAHAQLDSLAAVHARAATQALGTEAARP